MREGPDLFVLDLNLPRVDGLALLRQIRGREATAHTPVAVLTTSQAATDRSRCEALGADAYVVKPGNFTEFLDLVGAAVQALLSKAAGAVGMPGAPRLTDRTLRGRRFPLTAVLTRLHRRRAAGKARAARSQG